MNRLLTILVSVFLALGPASAQAAFWNDDDEVDCPGSWNSFTDSIKMYVCLFKTVRQIAGGSPEVFPKAMNRLYDQMETAGDRRDAVKDVLTDLLDFMQQRRADRQSFLYDGGSGQKCSTGTACDTFREKLQTFVYEMSELKAKLPALAKLGLDDVSFGENIIDKTPPFLLYALYQIMERSPETSRWSEIPEELSDIVDEIGDPEAFSVGWRDDEAALTQAATTQMVGIQRVQILSKSPTERFCERNRVKKLLNGAIDAIDPVRLNRIKLYIGTYKKTLLAMAEYPPDEIGGTVVGEGVDGVPIFVAQTMKAFVTAIDIVQDHVSTYRANLEICRARAQELEMDLLTCAGQENPVVKPEYKFEPANTEAYNLVVRRYEYYRDEENKTQAQTQTAKKSADNWRVSKKYSKAYPFLCRAYAHLGES